jgi:hypothetical protein
LTKQFAYLYTTDYFIHYISDTYKIENTKQLEKDTIEILGNRNSFNKKYLCERHKNEYLDRHLINSRLSNKYLSGSNELSQKYLQSTSERVEKYKKLIMDRALHKSEKVEELIAWFYSNYENPEGLVPYDSETGNYIYVSGGPYDPFEELSENFPDLDGLTVVKAAQAVLKTGVEWVRVGEY